LSASLLPIHRGIGASQRSARRVVSPQARDAERERYPRAGAAFLERDTQALDDGSRGVELEAKQCQGKLISPDAPDQVAPPEHAPRDLGEAPKDDIPRCVSKAVVRDFETVEVDENDAAADGRTRLELTGERLFEVRFSQQPGECVASPLVDHLGEGLLRHQHGSDRSLLLITQVEPVECRRAQRHRPTNARAEHSAVGDDVFPKASRARFAKGVAGAE